MRIQNFKKKLITLSLLLIVAGTLISITGYGITGFNYKHLQENVKKDEWYQTVHLGNNSLWYGIGINNNTRLIAFGGTD